MTVTGKEIKAFLKDADADSSLNKPFADGAVKIVSTCAKRKTRTGTSEHAEYYADDEKVILNGGASAAGGQHGRQDAAANN